METYSVRLRISPYSGVTRKPAPYLEEHELRHRGAPRPVVEITARDFDDACDRARVLADGVMLDERVWRVEVEAIEKKRE